MCGLKARVINDEVDVGEQLGHSSDIGTISKVRAVSLEGKAFVNTDIPYT
jgi:hypothetical protein